MDNKYCEKDKTALIRCSDCDGAGRTRGFPCPKCKGTDYLCQAHGPNWKK